ncbi:MAG: alpha/beta hydrolase domain-containing protein, partial [Acidobacteriota bacterium]
RVTRLVVEQRESPAYAGQSFGKAGQYETLRGHFFGELDPKDAHNTIITDLSLAPRNARGMVEYSGTFAIAKPLDAGKASGVLIYTVPNRGNGAPVGSTDGHISVVSGWQGDVTPRAGIQSIGVPVAKNPDGTSLTGPVIERFINMAPGATTLPIGTAPYVALTYQRPLTLDTSKASLTKRATQTGPAVPVPSSEWAFADCTGSPFPGVPDASKICAKGGFDPAFAYELLFTAKDPLVLGIGFAATRDLNSFLRYGDKDDTGAANPLAKQVKWALSRGSSQSGNFIRSYLNLGFNQDEANRIVWDGVNPHIAARQLALNIRFGVPGGAAGPYEPGSEGTLWWSDYTDTVRRRPASSLLDRCRASNTCPKIVETFGGLEFWYLRESPNLVGTDAKADIPLPPNVRRYFFPGTSHGGGRGGFSMATPAAPAGCVLPANPNPEAETLKAVVAALVEWVTQGTEPPPSRYPRLDRRELAQATGAAIGFPAIPGVPSPDGIVNMVVDNDFGPGFREKDLSGVISKEPPAARQMIPTLVPKVDADGSDVGGVPSVLRQVPLGSYLGWNLVAAGFEKGRQCGLSGGYVPFARTKAERQAAGDPRLSLEERYGSHAKYVALVKAAADRAVAERFLLREDAILLVAQAEASD